jgi:hypothetical protein
MFQLPQYQLDDMMTIDNVYGMDDIIGDPIGALIDTDVPTTTPAPPPSSSGSHNYWWLWLILVFVIIGFFFIIHFKK